MIMPQANILVVEDEPIVAKDIQMSLQRLGYGVPAMAASGEDAIRKTHESNPDLILMDIQLPVVNGYDATRRIKANPQLHHIPVIAVTSYALAGDEAKTREAGCDGYVAKPIDPAEVDRLLA